MSGNSTQPRQAGQYVRIARSYREHLFIELPGLGQLSKGANLGGVVLKMVGGQLMAVIRACTGADGLLLARDTMGLRFLQSVECGMRASTFSEARILCA